MPTELAITVLLVRHKSNRAQYLPTFLQDIPGGSQERVLEDGPRGYGPEKGKGSVGPHIVGSMSKGYQLEMS